MVSLSVRMKRGLMFCLKSFDGKLLGVAANLLAGFFPSFAGEKGWPQCKLCFNKLRNIFRKFPRRKLNVVENTRFY
jgi:hypothetical protein